jgi:hypothetical protein
MRSIAVIAPSCSFAYGICRWLDGRDGHHHNGPAWTVGHVLFFASIVLFAVLAAGLGRRRGTVATAAAVATWIGGACFLWVITGDLFRAFHDRWPLPGGLNIAGPLLFVVGMTTLIALEVRNIWSPALFLAGYLAISVDLDLLPIAALVILAACVPLARALPPGSAPRRSLAAR